MAGCQVIHTAPCSPNAEGNVPAGQFIRYTEFIDALKYMNQRPDWRRSWRSGRSTASSGTAPAPASAPTRSRARRAPTRSAGLPTTTLDRKKSDLFVVHVTDETVPDKGKKRYAISLTRAAPRRRQQEPHLRPPRGDARPGDGRFGDASFARQYDVDRAAFTAAGGRVAATSSDSGARDAQPVYTRVTLGEIGLGQGTLRVAGALLPQPTEEFAHTLGLEPYAVTYTGYIRRRNLLE